MDTVFFLLVQANLLDIEDVPVEWRDAVKAKIAEKAEK